MSTMPTKKKSRFQITSVIQAQVAGNCVTDDAESNDEPDESRTEHVSLETLDMRTDLGVCDRSSAEEALNHTGDAHNGPALVNGHVSVKSIGSGGRNTPINSGGNHSVPTASQHFVSTPIQPSPVSSSGATTSCSSRFRVIKLDLGNGEPFRRGRWVCTEFYEKDSDSNRTVDSAKLTTVHDHCNDRDITAAPRTFPVQPVESADGGHPKGLPAPFLSIDPQQPQVFASRTGSVTSAFQSMGYATTKTQQAYDSNPSFISQTHISSMVNGVQQTSPPMSSATPPQQLGFSNGVSTGQPLSVGSSSQSFAATSQSKVPLSSKPPASTTPGPGGQGSQAQGSQPALTPQIVSTRAVSPVSQTLGSMDNTSSPVMVISNNDVQIVPANEPSISAAPGHSSAPGAQTQDSRSKSDALPLSISSVVPGKAAAKPLITDGLSLPSPTVSFFGIPIPVNVIDDSVSGASVVAIDNKIEQAMDLVKNHLMYAVREEVEVLKEQIKELYERNSVLERENAVLKSLANSEQLSKLSTQLKQVNNGTLPQLQQQSASTNKNNALGHYEVVKSAPHQPNITTA